MTTETIPLTQDKGAGARFTTERYSKDCTRILNASGTVAALIERLSNDRWSIYVNNRALSFRTFATVKAAFAWWLEQTPPSEPTP